VIAASYTSGKYCILSIREGNYLEILLYMILFY